jgi:hypothetical protein
MGCDSHIYVERRTENGWEKVGKEFTYPYYRSGLKNEVYPATEEEGEWETNPVLTDLFYPERNYTLFAVLANVRNYGESEPIAKPRGIPEDASEGYKKIADEYGIDGHSHSYFTLAELNAVDWDAPHAESGLVDAVGYLELLATGCPGTWCQGSSAPQVTEDELKLQAIELIQAGVPGPDHNSRYNTISRLQSKGGVAPLTWYRSRRTSIGYGWFRALRDLEHIGKPEDVRLVFFFDN